MLFQDLQQQGLIRVLMMKLRRASKIFLQTIKRILSIRIIKFQTKSQQLPAIQVSMGIVLPICTNNQDGNFKRRNKLIF